jgi:hypothetical protein
MFVTSEKMKPNRENKRGLSLAVVKRLTIKVTRQSLQHELHELRHDLLYQT